MGTNDHLHSTDMINVPQEKMGCPTPRVLGSSVPSPAVDAPAAYVVGKVSLIDSTEVRVTDPQTGGQKGTKLARFSLIPRDFLWALAEHYGKGARKYEDRNWERGYKWSLSLDALERHLNQWLLGEEKDPETGSSHLIAAAWHLIALWWFERNRKGTDDLRPSKR